MRYNRQSELPRPWGACDGEHRRGARGLDQQDIRGWRAASGSGLPGQSAGHARGRPLHSCRRRRHRSAVRRNASLTRRIAATLQTAAAKRAARMPVHAESAPLRLLPLVLLLLRHPCCCGPPGHACAHSHSQGCADCIDHDAPTLTHVGVRVPVHARVLTRCGASACGSCCRVGTWYYFCERHLCWRVAVVLRLEALTVDAAAPGFSSCGH